MVKRMLQVLVVIAAAAGMLTILFLAVKTRKLQVNRWVVKDSDIVGVDISEYQADVDMEKLAEQNVKFIYMKATEGSGFTDSRFADNWAAAAEHGIPAGAYHFFSFDSPGSMQAQNYIDTVGQLGIRNLIPAVDVEFYADKRNDPPEREELIRELKKTNPNIEKSIFNSIHSVWLDTMPGYKSEGQEHSFLERYRAMEER